MKNISLINKTHSVLLLIVTIAFTVFGITSSQAAAFITSPGNGSITDFNFGITVGSTFTVGSSNLSATSLGIWDENGDGFVASHDVGIWDSSSMLIATVTIPSGTSATLVGEFRYIDLVSPVILTQGQSYHIGAFFGPNPDTDTFRSNGGTGVTFSSDFNTIGYGYAGGSSLADFTVTGAGANPYVGPNLQYTAVPEPATAMLFMVGGATWFLLRRKRQA